MGGQLIDRIRIRSARFPRWECLIILVITMVRPESSGKGAQRNGGTVPLPSRQDPLQSLTNALYSLVVVVYCARFWDEQELKDVS